MEKVLNIIEVDADETFSRMSAIFIKERRRQNLIFAHYYITSCVGQWVAYDNE